MMKNQEKMLNQQEPNTSSKVKKYLKKLVNNSRKKANYFQTFGFPSNAAASHSSGRNQKKTNKK
jgi:hypothetical protein